ncbi:hypothetical protein P7C71_g5011, partial [Lecanoromycetidae sp. Uapishka_2]
MSERVAKAIQEVQKAAEADHARTGQAHVDLLDAVRKLTEAAETPAERLMRMRFQPIQNAAIRMAVESGVLETIGAAKGKCVTSQELEKETGYDALLVTRFMRLVCYVGVVDEVGDGEYVANPTTYLINTPPMIGGEKHHFDLFFPIGAKLPEYIREKKIHQFPNKEAGEFSPFHYTFKQSLFEFFDQNTDHQKWFGDYMSGRRAGFATWHETFPFAEILGPDVKKGPNEILLVDVAGNNGHEAVSLHESHPDLPGRIVCEDLPPVVDMMTKKGHHDKVEFIKYDFFTPQPIRGARAYYFRNICHDWPDDACQKFLSQTAKSMEKGYSYILIDDYVVPDTGASLRASSMDMLMMFFCSGIERTRKQWDKLLDSCGLEIVKIWGTRSDYEHVIQAQLKD